MTEQRIEYDALMDIHEATHDAFQLYAKILYIAKNAQSVFDAKWIDPSRDGRYRYESLDTPIGQSPEEPQ